MFGNMIVIPGMFVKTKSPVGLMHIHESFFAIHVEGFIAQTSYYMLFYFKASCYCCNMYTL